MIFRRLARALVNLLACLGGLLLLVTISPPRWYIGWLSEAWNPPQGAVLIVLGGDHLDRDVIGESSYWRAVFAVLAWREGNFRHVLISGAGTSALMRDFLISQGVPAGAISLEEKSGSTHENALYSAPLARQWPGPYTLLTSDFHMWRARRAFEKAGLEVVPMPFSDAYKRVNDWRSRWRVFLDLAAETAKIGYYRMKGWA